MKTLFLGGIAVDNRLLNVGRCAAQRQRVAQHIVVHAHAQHEHAEAQQLRPVEALPAQGQGHGPDDQGSETMFKWSIKLMLPKRTNPIIYLFMALKMLHINL